MNGSNAATTNINDNLAGSFVAGLGCFWANRHAVVKFHGQSTTVTVEGRWHFTVERARNVETVASLYLFDGANPVEGFDRVVDAATARDAGRYLATMYNDRKRAFGLGEPSSPYSA